MNSNQDDGVVSVARALRLIHGAMAGGIVLLAAVVGFMYSLHGGKTPPDNAFQTLNLFSALLAVLTLSAWGASIVLFKLLARKAVDPQGAQTAFIVRAALREGPALFGLVICLLGSMSGAIRVQPVYWAASLPAWLFVGWIAVTLPDEQAVRSVLLDASAQNR